MIDAAKQCGMSEADAKKYADQLGLIPGNVGTKITENAPLTRGEVERYTNALTNVPSVRDSVLRAFDSGAIKTTDDVNRHIRSIPARKDTDLNAHDHASGAVQNVLNWFKQIPSKIDTWVNGTYSVSEKSSFGGRSSGGPVGFASGGGPYGLVRGPGSTTSDSIPVMLSDREYVIRAWAAQRIGLAALNRLNRTGKVEASSTTRVLTPSVIQTVTITNNGVKDPYVDGTIYGRRMAASARLAMRRQL